MAEEPGGTGGPTQIADHVDRPAPTRGPFGLDPGIGALEFVAVGIVLLVPLVDFPVVDGPAFTFRAALLLAVVGPGLVLLADLARRGDRAALLAVGFVGVAALSATLSATPLLSLVGSYGVDRGALVLAGYAGCWAIGRRSDPAVHRLLVGAFLVAVLANVGWGVLQVLWGDKLGALAAVDGRAAGFTASSVYLGGLVAGALAVVGYLIAHAETIDRAFVVLLVVAGVCSLGANLSGSRIALLGGVILALAPSVRRQWRRALLLLVALALGVAAGQLVPQATSSTGRISAGTESGITPRLDMWTAAAGAVTHHPLIGWGPGRFRAATSPRITPSYVLSEGQDKLFFDAHDIVVEQGTTVGLIGLALLAGWIAVASRRARGPLAWLALGVAATWLLEPVSIASAPVAMVALGAAAPALARRQLSVPWRGVAAVLTGAGLIAGGLVIVASHDVKQASHNGSIEQFAAAQRLLPPDPAIDDDRTQLLLQKAIGKATPANRAAVLAAARATVHLEPERPDWWTRLGVTEFRFGTKAQAKVAFEHALRRDPWSESALVGLEQVAIATHDERLRAATNAKLCRIRSTFCQET